MSRSDAMWQNWSGSVRANPTVFHHPTSVGEICEIVAQSNGKTVRVTGSGYSFSPVSISNDIMLSLADMPETLEISEDRTSVIVSAGTTLRSLNQMLATEALALDLIVDTDAVTISGAISTGTHGTGGSFGPLHTVVEGIEVVDGTGQRRWLREEELPAGRLGLGLIGIITRVKLAVTSSFRVATMTTRVPLKRVLQDFEHHVADHRHAEFSWVPSTKWAHLTLADATLSEPIEPSIPQRLKTSVLEHGTLWAAGVTERRRPRLAAPLGRVLTSRGVKNAQSRRSSENAFASVQWVRFQEMEYSVPLAALDEAVNALDQMIRTRHFSVSFPIGVQVLDADDAAWLSPTYGRRSACISVRSFKGIAYGPYFKEAEAIFQSFGGRPHWGKMHTMSADELAERYPRWEAFQNVRTMNDPDRVFESGYLRRLLGSERGENV